MIGTPSVFKCGSSQPEVASGKSSQYGAGWVSGRNIDAQLNSNEQNVSHSCHTFTVKYNPMAFPPNFHSLRLIAFFKVDEMGDKATNCNLSGK